MTPTLAWFPYIFIIASSFNKCSIFSVYGKRFATTYLKKILDTFVVIQLIYESTYIFLAFFPPNKMKFIIISTWNYYSMNSLGAKLTIDVLTMKLMDLSFVMTLVFIFTHFQQPVTSFKHEFHDAQAMFPFGLVHNRRTSTRCPPMYTNRGSKNANLCLRFAYLLHILLYRLFYLLVKHDLVFKNP